MKEKDVMSLVENNSFAVITLTEAEDQYIQLMVDSSNASKESLVASIWQMGMMAFIDETESMINGLMGDSASKIELVLLKNRMDEFRSLIKKS